MIPLQGLYTYLNQMLSEEWGYIWGTAGTMWTEEKQRAVQYGADSYNETAKKYGSKWIGHMVTDCSGVMVYIWNKYNLKIAHGSNTIARQYCKKMQTLPRPGYAAFKWKDDPTGKWSGGDYYHIGIVGEDGETVYESQGTITGFTTSPASRWDYFAAFKDVDYEGTKSMTDITAGCQAKVNIDTGWLNVRNEPSRSGDIIGKLNKDEVVDVVAVYPKEGFAYVKTPRITGYASCTYLERIDKPIEEPKEDGKWAVVILCESKEDADRFASLFKDAFVAKEGDADV